MHAWIYTVYFCCASGHARQTARKTSGIGPSVVYNATDTLREQVTKEARGWAYLFRKMQEAKVTFDLADYGVSQTSLEQASPHCDCALDASRSVCMLCRVKCA